MRIITPPEPIGIRDTEKSLFLTGSIDNGSAPMAKIVGQEFYGKKQYY